MESLIDAGLPFLLRWSLDDSTDAVYCAAIYGIYAMVWNCKDQVSNALHYSNSISHL